MKVCRSLFLVAAVFTGACATSPSIPASPLPGEPPDRRTDTPREESQPVRTWRFTPTSQAQSYSSLTTSIVFQDNAANRRDSLTSRASYSLSTTRNADSLSFSGSITSFSTEGPVPGKDEAKILLPVRFTGTIVDHNLHAQITGNAHSESCDDPSRTPLGIVQRSLFSLPPEIQTQQTWTDSISSLVCSGTLPIILTSVRTFRVEGQSEFEGLAAIIIAKTERTFSSGEGSQEQHRIIVESQGSSSGRLYLDISSGQLLGANSTNKTVLSIQSSGRVQHFTQISTEITRQNR